MSFGIIFLKEILYSSKIWTRDINPYLRKYWDFLKIIWIRDKNPYISFWD